MAGLLAFVTGLSEPLSESLSAVRCCCFFDEDGSDCCCGFAVVEALFNFTTTAVMLSVLPSCNAACTRACAYSSADNS